MVATSRDGSVSFHHQRWRTESEKTRQGIEEVFRTPGNKRVTLARIPRTRAVFAAHDCGIRTHLQALRGELRGHRNGTGNAPPDIITERNRNGNSSAFTEIRPSIRRTFGRTLRTPRAQVVDVLRKTPKPPTSAPRPHLRGRPVSPCVRGTRTRTGVPPAPVAAPAPRFRTFRNTGIPRARLSAPAPGRRCGAGTPVAAGIPAVSWRRARRSPTQGMDASPVRLGAPVRRTSRHRESRPLPAAPPCTHGTRPAPLAGAGLLHGGPGPGTPARARAARGFGPGKDPRTRRRARHPWAAGPCVLRWS